MRWIGPDLSLAYKEAQPSVTRSLRWAYFFFCSVQWRCQSWCTLARAPPSAAQTLHLLTLASPSLRGATAACPPSSLPPSHSTGRRTARPDPSPLPRPYKRRPGHFMASQILSPQPLPHHGHATTRSSRPSPPAPLTPHQGAYLTRACLSSTLDMFDILSWSGRLLSSSQL